MKSFCLKKSLFFGGTLLFIYCPMLYSQDIQWEKSYGGKQAEYLFDAQPTADYGFILAGSSLSKKSGNKTDIGHGDLDYWIWKMNENGEDEWQKSFGGSGTDLLQSIKNTRDGGFILAGTSTSFGEDVLAKSNSSIPERDGDKTEKCRGDADFWVIKLDAKGNEDWQKTIGGIGQETLQSIFQTSDGGYILGGSSASPSNPTPDETSKGITTTINYGEKTAANYGNMDYWIVKLNKDGKIEWQKTFGGIYYDDLRSIEQTTDKGYLLGGYSNSPISGNKTEDNIGIGDYWVIKLDEKGNQEWQKTIGGDRDDQLAVVHQTFDGHYMIAGSSNSSQTASGGTGSKAMADSDFWVLQLDTKGQILWQETYNFDKLDVLTSLIENPDHSFLIGGFAQAAQSSDGNNPLQKNKDSRGVNDYIALKISPTGENLWSKTVGSDGQDVLKKAVETRDGGYLMAGTSNCPITLGKAKGSRDRSSSNGGNDFWVVKLKDRNKISPPKINIEAIPNPANSFTNIIVGYDFDDGTATLVDLSGRQLQRFAIYSRTVAVDMSNLPEGVYIINIETNKGQDGVKVIKSNK